MTTDVLRQAVQFQATKLGPRLFEGMSYATADADRRVHGLDHTKYPHLRPLLTRSLLREYLESNGLPTGWRLEGNPALMGQLMLASPENQMIMRFLKERRRAYPGGVPVAGSSTARQQYWDLDGGGRSDWEANLLLLWDYIPVVDGIWGFTLRIVNTIESGIFGREVRCDLNLDVVGGGEIFDNLEWQGDEQEQSFFNVEVDPAANDW
ncbi:hypothetical protein [Pengzhenrongella sp.]|jgi:hypothetical protein|uniref:hypothetical protein n=1 Tax=Pengzhenrongella sp. TaxID=2888820 RepID=UPI002F952FAA